MAATKVKSVLAGKLGAKLDTAVKKHADDDTTYGIINLPGGITNGIAQLSKCYFKEYGPDTNMKKADGTSAKGEFYFRAEGTVNSPNSVATPDGVVPVKGLTTSVMVSLIEQKRGQGANAVIVSLEDQIQQVLNIMRQLAGPDFTKGATGADLEGLAASLEEAAPYFRFSTSQGKPSAEYPNPRVFENWHGNKGLENYQPEETSAFNTATSTTPSQNGKVTSPQVPEKRVDAIVPVSEMDLDDLVELAKSEADTAEEARATLVAKGVESGWTEEELTSEEVSWDQVKEMIENPKQEEQQNSVPVKGQTAKYSPPSKKKPGTLQPERECQITAVDTKSETVTLKDLTTKPPGEYKSIPWSELS